MARKQLGAAPSATTDAATKGYVDTANLANCTGLPVSGISATGTPGSSTYLRGDGSWATVPGISTGKAIAMAMVFG
jgi:hypothetical protein